MHYGDAHGNLMNILYDTMYINQSQFLNMMSLLQKHIYIRGSTIGILGLSFKPETDDTRESRAISIIKSLKYEGARIIAYDPVAMENFKKIEPDIEYAQSPQELLLKSDAVLIVTEWGEFAHLDYTGKIVIDGRRIEQARKTAKVYEGVCW
jgi:UDPglucose 6-dehydrogenase